jgi:hypothetical protein
LGTLVQVAEIVRRDAAHRRAVVILGDALHRERQVVVARPFALARACDRIEARGAVVRSHPFRRHDPDRLAFETGGGAAEVEDEMPDVAGRASAASGSCR